MIWEMRGEGVAYEVWEGCGNLGLRRQRRCLLRILRMGMRLPVAMDGTYCVKSVDSDLSSECLLRRKDSCTNMHGNTH